jgi:hypothetical protein
MGALFGAGSTNCKKNISTNLQKQMFGKLDTTIVSPASFLDIEDERCDHRVTSWEFLMHFQGYLRDLEPPSLLCK